MLVYSRYYLQLLLNKRLSLKRGIGECGHGFSRFNGFGGLGGLGGFSGFDGFDGYSMLSLKGYFVSFSLQLKVLCLLVSYSLSYTWLKREPQISIRKERFILSLLIYFKLTKLQKFLQK